MKSLIKVLVILCLSQIICCSSDTYDDFIVKIRNSEIIPFIEINQFYKVIEKCDQNEMFDLLSESNVFMDIDIYESSDVDCSNKELIKDIESKLTKLKSFFLQCIDPNYVEFVEKVYEFNSKLLKQRCQLSDKEVEELRDIVDARDKTCRKESMFEMISCIFSEPEAMEISESFSNFANFTVELLNGNDKQCGVVNRIEKCFLRSISKCENRTLPKHIEYTFNLLMKIFECKVDETIDIPESSTEPIKMENLIETFENATKNCKIDEIIQTFLEKEQKLESNDGKLSVTRRRHFDILEKLCIENSEKLNNFKSLVSESALNLTKCIDPNYVNHVKMLETVFFRLTDLGCSFRDQIDPLLKHKAEPSKFNNVFGVNFPNVYSVMGCVYSQPEVRELINDRSLISNFTLELLEGNEKKCGTLNKIQTCIVETFDKSSDKNGLNIFKIASDKVLEAIDCKRHEFSSDWKSIENKSSLYKEFMFQDFNEAFGFMTRVALYAEKVRYYPELNTVNNTVKVIVTSDRSSNSLKLTKFVDKITRHNL